MRLSFKKYVPLAVIVAVVLGVNTLQAAWSNPKLPPTGDNVDAPINTGGAFQSKSGDLGVDALSAAGLTVSGVSSLDSITTDQRVTLDDNDPTIYFKDNATSNTWGHRDWWIHVNSDRMYFLANRDDDDDTWGGTPNDGPWPLEMYAGAQGSGDTTDWARFANQVRANEYCDSSGSNCISPSGGGGGSDVGSSVCQDYQPTNPSLWLACPADMYVAGLKFEGATWSGSSDSHSYPEVDTIRCCSLRVGASGTGGAPMAATFVTQFSALMSDPVFRSQYTSSGGNVPSGLGGAGQWRDDRGWYIRSNNNAKFTNTVNKICSYMMTNGVYQNGAIGYDYGSDNNNVSWRWNGSSWVAEVHGDNGAIDVIQVNCSGDSVSARGNWWLKSNRPESCSDGGYRCNPYPAP